MAGLYGIAAAALLAAFGRAANPHPDLGGYKPASNVVEHSQMVLDIDNITTAAGNGDFSTAKAIYTGGRFSCKSTTTARTLQGFVKSSTVSAKLVGKAFFDSFTNGSGPTNAPIPGAGRLSLAGTFWDDFMLGALDGTGRFASSSVAMRKVAVKKGVLGVLTMYVTYELESAISKAAAGNTDDKTGAPHAWDEGWAFYYGIHQTPGKYSAWEFTKKRDLDYAYDSSNARVSGAVEGKVDILAHFLEGLRASRSGDVAQMVASRDSIYRILALSSIRAALKYAYETQKSSYNEEYHMEAYAYFLPAAGWVEQASAGAGSSVLALLDFQHDSTSLNADLYCAVKAALIPAYVPLGLDCTKVGTYKKLSGKSCSATCPSVQGALPAGIQGYVPDVTTDAGSNVDCGYDLSSTIPTEPENETNDAPGFDVFGGLVISLAATASMLLHDF